MMHAHRGREYHTIPLCSTGSTSEDYDAFGGSERHRTKLQSSLLAQTQDQRPRTIDVAVCTDCSA